MPAKDARLVELADMQWEETWKAMMSELGGDAKILDLRRMSAPLAISPKDVKEQMMMRLDEIGENFENLKATVVSYTTNKTEQARGGQNEMQVPMEVDHVSGSDPEEEDVQDVDEVRWGSTCHKCGMTGHFAKDCRKKGKGSGKGGDGSKGHARGKGKTMKGTGKKGSGNSEGHKGELSEESKSWRYLVWTLCCC